MFLYLTPRLSEASQSRSLYRLICISKRQSFPVCGQADLFRANSTRFIAVMCRIQSLSVCLWISFRYLSGVPLAASGSERQPSGSFTAAMFRLGTPIKMHVQSPKFVISLSLSKFVIYWDVNVSEPSFWHTTLPPTFHMPYLRHCASSPTFLWWSRRKELGEELCLPALASDDRTNGIEQLLNLLGPWC